MRTIIRNFKFKQRLETEQICVVCRKFKNGETKADIYKQSRRFGGLDTGFHIIIYNTGLVETDREITAVAGRTMPYFDTSIYVLLDAPNKTHITDAQKLALERLTIQYDLPIKYIEV